MVRLQYLPGHANARTESKPYQAAPQNLLEIQNWEQELRGNSPFRLKLTLGSIIAGAGDRPGLGEATAPTGTHRRQDREWATHSLVWLQHPPKRVKTVGGQCWAGLKHSPRMQGPGLGTGLVGGFWDSPAGLQLLLVSARAGAVGRSGWTRLQHPLVRAGIGASQVG